MTPERLRQIEELYHAVREHGPDARAALLAIADPELRRQVESLLAQSVSGDVMERPVIEVAADLLAEQTVTQLAVGALLGPYKIESRLGAGGMGTVYRARDTRLGRAIAIKLVHERFSERFEREARAISALNHPNICTLYDVGENYLVMELVEGETLGARLKKGALPMDQVLRYGAQIADALAAAHAKGITHRDLKPGNIMLGKAGVKVLDFGLARSTHDETLTLTNAVMGTPAYMAPEQREGLPCDARTDIYALGLILAEMAIGKRQSTEGLSGPFGHVVARCLAKEPDDRWQNARDVKAELEYAAKPPAKPAGISTSPVRWAWIGLAVAAVLTLGWTIEHLRQRPAETSMVRLEISPPAGAEFRSDSGVAISPDGRLIAFVARAAGGDKLWLRPLDSPSAHELPGTDGANFPFWSPDSKSIGFFASGKLRRIEIAGGFPAEICDVPVGRGGTWSLEGTILFNAVNDGPLLRVSASGGTAAPLTALDAAKKENSHRWPFFLPDGRHFLYFVRGTPEVNGIYESSLDQPGEKTRVRLAPTNGIYAPGEYGQAGRLLWVDNGSLMAQTFDPASAKLSGEPLAIAEGVAFGDASRLGSVSVSNQGSLVYGAAMQDLRQLTWYGRDGKPQGLLGQPDSYSNLRISPDGKSVALIRTPNVWEIEFTRGIPVRIATSGMASVWSPDGRQIAFARGAPVNMFVRNLDGSGEGEALHKTHDSEMPLDWSPDGRFLLFQLNPNDPASKTQIDLDLLPMTGNREPQPFLASRFREWWGRFSPDGRWIAYGSDESGQDEVYIQSFPANGMKWRVSTKGGTAMVWRGDGKELFYVSPDRKIMSVPVRVTGGTLEIASPVTLFSIPLVADQGISAYTYDVMPDGERFLVLTPISETGPPPLGVVLHWQTALQSR